MPWLDHNERRLKDIYTDQAKSGIGGWFEMTVRQVFRGAAIVGVIGVAGYIALNQKGCTSHRDGSANTGSSINQSAAAYMEQLRAQQAARAAAISTRLNEIQFYTDKKYSIITHSDGGKIQMTGDTGMTCIYPNGDRYRGHCVNGVRNGSGTYIWAEDGKMYRGQWVNGERHGTGETIDLHNPSSGNWKFSELWVHNQHRGPAIGRQIFGEPERSIGGLHDAGRYSGPSGFAVNSLSHYTGEYPFNVKRSQISYPNGDKYDGETSGIFSKEKRGLGVLTLANGDRYQGVFYNDMLNTLSEALLSRANGDFFLGVYTRNEMSTGLYVWANGNTYSGDWKNGQKHGGGVFVKANGDIYDGGWTNDRKNGRGILIQANGTVEDGYWNNDVFIGTSPAVNAVSAPAVNL